jgi:hypothetical protein
MESSLDPRATDLLGDLLAYLWTRETLMSKLAGDDSFPEIKVTLVRDLSKLIDIKNTISSPQPTFDIIIIRI